MDLEALDITPIDLSDQELPFTEEEIWTVMKDMPGNRAPGPDGFIEISFPKILGNHKEG